ncbi:MAG TPA: hypothetical protein VNK96_04370 [Fimbriimonadales bacterium]|nr:hypothetical protein [Fimbriimonadales bacterium]
MEILRFLATSIVCLILVVGYFAQQYYYLQGREALRDWTDFVYTPNLYLGWIIVVLGIFFSIIRKPQDNRDCR